MKSCSNCAIGECHGYSRNPNIATTVYFWCPKKEHHNPSRKPCELFVPGENKLFDKRGNRLTIADAGFAYLGAKVVE